MFDSIPMLDRSALRVSQAVVVVLLVIAFVGGWVWLVAGVGLVLAAGAATNRPGFGLLYTRVLLPAGWMRPDRDAEDAAPHRFAQALGAGMLLVAAVALLADHPLAGWSLAWVVVALASLNLATGICVGCALHYALARLGVRGFARGATRRRDSRR